MRERTINEKSRMTTTKQADTPWSDTAQSELGRYSQNRRHLRVPLTNVAQPQLMEHVISKAPFRGSCVCHFCAALISDVYNQICEE